MAIKTETLFDIPFINTTQKAFVEQLKHDINEHKSNFVVTANPEIVMYAKDNPEFMDVIKHASYVTPDGIGVIKASQILNKPLTERITGYDTTVALLKFANDHSKKIFLLGAKPEINDLVVSRIKQDYPNVVIAGAEHGYFSNQTEVEQKIIDATPDIVFIALGYPKQEYFIKDSFSNSKATWIGIGGSFDVLSGTKQRAPKLFQQMHLEWLYRLLQEPSRITRMSSIPKFIFFTFSNKIKGTD